MNHPAGPIAFSLVSCTKGQVPSHNCADGIPAKRAARSRPPRLANPLLANFRYASFQFRAPRMPGPVLLTHDLIFPPPSWATEDGLIAVGGDLRPERLLLAYRSGIFPWPHEGLPLLWFCPDPRMVLLPHEVHVSRSLRKFMRKQQVRVTLDRDFARVIRSCARIPRGNNRGTWITRDMIDAYMRLHELGYAHSVETWRGEKLVGGLYGVSVGAGFFGESMFARSTNASKVAFIALVRQLQRWQFHLIDCQMHTNHLASLGARQWSLSQFLSQLSDALKQTTRCGQWELDEDLAMGGT